MVVKILFLVLVFLFSALIVFVENRNIQRHEEVAKVLDKISNKL